MSSRGNSYRAICIGFGEHDGKCDQLAGSSHSKLWCQRCDDLRLVKLSAQMKAISDSFKVKEGTR